MITRSIVYKPEGVEINDPTAASAVIIPNGIDICLSSNQGSVSFSYNDINFYIDALNRFKEIYGQPITDNKPDKTTIK